jgi:hypothetical protein
MAALVAMRHKQAAERDDAEMAAATKMAALWRGKLVRKLRVERRVPVISLLAAIEVSKRRRSGLVAFCAYLCYTAFLGLIVITLSNSSEAYTMENSVGQIFDDPRIQHSRKDVSDLDSLWSYVRDLNALLYDEGQALRNYEPYHALLKAMMASACPFTAAAVRTNPCTNSVCLALLSGAVASAAAEDACMVVIGVHCAAYPTEPACARFAPPASCQFAQASPTNPCQNPVCGPTAGAVQACDAVVTAHCSLFPSEAGCTNETDATETSRRQLGEHPAQHPRRRLGGERYLPSDELAGMLDHANRAIGGLLIWQARYKTEPCAHVPEYVHRCVVRDSFDVEGFKGDLTGNLYTANELHISGIGELQLAAGARADARIDGTPVRSMFMLPTDVGLFEASGDAADQQAAVAVAQADGWLNHAVRKVVLSLNVYNANIERYAAVLVAFDFAPGGIVRSRRSVSSAPVDLLGALPQSMQYLLVLVLVLDTLLIALRALVLIASYHAQFKARLDAWWSRVRRRWRGAMKLASLQRSHTANLSPLGAGSSRDFSWGSNLWGTHEGARQLREAELAARHPWWLFVELLACTLAWTYVVLLQIGRRQTLRANEVFQEQHVVGGGTDQVVVETLETLSNSIELTFQVLDLATLAKGMSYQASLVVLLMLQRMFKVCGCPLTRPSTWRCAHSCIVCLFILSCRRRPIRSRTACAPRLFIALRAPCRTSGRSRTRAHSLAVLPLSSAHVHHLVDSLERQGRPFLLFATLCAHHFLVRARGDRRLWQR